MKLLLLLLLFSFLNCRHYFVRDSQPYKLNFEEEAYLKNKKIGLIGFHPFISQIECMSCFFNNSPNQYYNTETVNTSRIKNFIQDVKASDSKVRQFVIIEHGPKGSRMRIITELDTDKPIERFIEFGKRLRDLEITRVDEKIPEENIKKMVKNFEANVGESGLREVEFLFDFSDPQKLKIKNFSVDYWIVGYHGEPRPEVREDWKTYLTIFPSIFTLFTFPTFNETDIESNFLVYDKQFNLVKSFNYKNNVVVMISWLTGIPSGFKTWNKSGNIYDTAYEPDLKEFSRDFAQFIKDHK